MSDANDTTWTTTVLDIQRAVQALQDSLPQLDMGSATPEQKTDLGQALWNLSEAAREALEPIKTSLRDAALKARQQEPGMHIFTGPLGGQCSVVIPQPTIKMRKGVDIASLAADLQERFDLLFETQIKYVPRKTLREELEAMEDPESTRKVMASVDVGDPTPRVSFSKG